MLRHLLTFGFLILVLAACSTNDGITTTPPIATPVPNTTEAVNSQPIDNELPPVTAVTSINLTPVLTKGLKDPVYLTHAGDNRLFIVERPGTFRIIQNGELLPEPFLDISDRAKPGAERGLLSVAFHPNYAENGTFFVNYTDSEGNTIISRFLVTDNPNLADAASELKLLTIPQPFPNHNGGLVKFGPDGYLYVGMGDGGGAGDSLEHGQNGNTLLGAMLRVDVDGSNAEANYAIPADNPFVDSKSRNEIWAIGVRNPWRFSFDRETGDLMMADVGQGEKEEINFQPAASSGGENYGWNILEGSDCYNNDTCDDSGTVLPIYEYGHENGRCSITGGYIYRGQQFPSLTGNYFFGDYCSGEIWALTPANNNSWSAQYLIDTDLNIASFGEDVSGEIYVIDLKGGIYQIQP